MGMDLLGKKRDFRWQIDDWPCVLEMARHYGWDGIGTKRLFSNYVDGPEWDGSEWDGNYRSNDYQYVEPGDARNLADALDRFLAEVQGNTFFPPKNANHWHYKWIREEGVHEYARDFVSFCREGGFTIS